MTDGASAATPEVAAYLAQKEVAQQSATTIWRRVAISLGVVLLITIGALIYVSVAVSQIRSTQVANTMLTDQRSQCQDKSFNAILEDARLAFTGDHNPADYAKAPKKC